jgi:hypothetical protein
MGLRAYGDYAGSFADIGFVDNYAMSTGVVGYADVSYGYGYWASDLTGIRMRMQQNYDVSLKDSLGSAQEFSFGYSYYTAVTDTSTNYLYLPYELAYFVNTWL